MYFVQHFFVCVFPMFMYDFVTEITANKRTTTTIRVKHIVMFFAENLSKTIINIEKR